MMMKMQIPRSARQICAAIVFLTASASTTFADTTLRVGKAMGQAFTFSPLDVGQAMGFFKKRDLTINKFDFAGSARLQQAMAAKSIDIGLGSGPEFSMVIKGIQNTGVAELAGKPYLLVLVVPTDSPVKSEADLQGKKIAVSTAGSLTQWLVRALSQKKGWGPNGIQSVALGADTAMIAAMKTHQVDGMVTDLGTAYRLQEAAQGKIFVRFGDIVDHFIIHVIWARTAVIESDPSAVQSFLAGWFETIAFMKADKQKTIAITAPIMNVDPQIASKVYDELMPTMSDDGKFDAAGLDVLAASFPDLGLTPTKPDLSKYIVEKYLPSGLK
jgi:NitT/TauT family transport system substrate-binding protein